MVQQYLPRFSPGYTGAFCDEQAVCQFDQGEDGVSADSLSPGQMLRRRVLPDHHLSETYLLSQKRFLKIG
jgi:hypothetical protein